MKLATLRTPRGTTAVRVEGNIALELGFSDVGELLQQDGWRQRATTPSGAEIPLPGTGTNGTATYAPLVLAPSKIVCVGLNYRNHILEMGRSLPEYPTLFAKFPETLIGAHDDIVISRAGGGAVDWEAELAVIVGQRVRAITVDDATAAIAGYTVMNDTSMRDWQNRTGEWLQGKNWEASTPLGPVLVTPDELDDGGLEIETEVDGEVMQRATTADLLFSPEELVSYISTFTTLNPGDVIATGTPGGVGHARDPQRYLADRSVVATRVKGIGENRNRVVVH